MMSLHWGGKVGDTHVSGPAWEAKAKQHYPKRLHQGRLSRLETGFGAHEYNDLGRCWP